MENHDCYDNVTNTIKYTANAKQYLFKANINLSAFPRDNRCHFLLSTLLTVYSNLRPGQINSNNSSFDLSAAETAHRMLLISLQCHCSMVLACQSRHLFPSNEDVKISCDIHTIAHSISITALKSSPLSAADVRRLTAPRDRQDCFSSVRVHCAAAMLQQWSTVDITDERTRLQWIHAASALHSQVPPILNTSVTRPGMWQSLARLWHNTEGTDVLMNTEIGLERVKTSTQPKGFNIEH